MTLLLKSNDISPYANSGTGNNTPYSLIISSTAGTMTGSRTNAIFNINLDELLGEEYRDNELFQIELLQYAHGNKSFNDTFTYGGYANYTNTNLCTKMSGLNFVNGDISVYLGAYNFRGVAAPSTVFSGFRNNTAVFKKPMSPQIQLNLQLFSIEENITLPSSWFTTPSTVAPPFIYLFRITPYTDEYIEMLSVN